MDLLTPTFWALKWVELDGLNGEGGTVEEKETRERGDDEENARRELKENLNRI